MAGKAKGTGYGIVLDVSAEIINRAVTRDSSHCVIADALAMAVPEARRIAVDLQSIRFTIPAQGRRYVFLTPAAAQVVLVEFDQGVKPEPFLMRLGRPAQIVRMNPNRSTSKSAPSDELPPGRARKAAPVDDTRTTRPVVLGGDYPPTAALSSTRGRRRTFGLRSLRP